MSFRTIVVPEPLEKKLTYATSALFVGSCFATVIGDWLRELKMPVMVNPFGTLYNPFSIHAMLERMLEQRPFTGEELVRYQDKWLSLMHDTSFSGEEKEEVLERMNRVLEEGAAHLRKLHHLFITFGTARVYRWRKDGRVVANCHKLPASFFTRELLQPEEITEQWEPLLSRLFGMVPGLQVILTVSPVRHWKDGATGNQLSKSVLHVAVHRLTEMDPRIRYFPAYEILMDDLRDYRFYAADMLHLSDTAEAYVRMRFREAVIDREAWPVMKEVEKLQKAKAHRPFRPGSEDHRRFRKRMLEKVLRLEERYPFLDLNEEKQMFSQ